MKKVIFLAVLFVRCCPAFSAVLFVDDYLAINSGDNYAGDEIFVIDDGLLEMFGGMAGKIEARDNSNTIIKGGSIYWLDAKGNSTLEIHEGEIGEGALGVYDNSTVYLFAYDIFFTPSDEYGKSTIEGAYYLTNEDFVIPLWDKENFSMIQIVPEPATLFLISLGAILFRRR